ncbi:unnamed protein product [Bursaphelenchus xylophilus]|uniref:(pine wood nematode) hypothetical protein n=1 Tax=Bursaphelenchus xylophilus TaxID=6326 RepID=A0A1I7S3P2_BURXY|nr:unnamed protein product [Bursaphelenchus xylophilus]CAG9116440.1 unnamed protein product [Bursaphelenchus xylophilus]
MWCVVAASLFTSILFLLCGGKSKSKSKPLSFPQPSAERSKRAGRKSKTIEAKASSPSSAYKDKIRPIPPNSERLNVQTAKALRPVRRSATEQLKDPPKVDCEKVEEPTKSDEKDKKSKEPKTGNSENKTEGDKKEQKTKGTEADDEEAETICDVTKLKNLGSLDLKVNQDMEAMNRESFEMPSRHEEGPRAETHSNKTVKRVVIKDAECKIYETDDVETVDDEADLPNVDL